MIDLITLAVAALIGLVGGTLALLGIVRSWIDYRQTRGNS